MKAEAVQPGVVSKSVKADGLAPGTYYLSVFSQRGESNPDLPYLISVVPDPVIVVREMRRVCRMGGRIIVLNHFRSPNPLLARIERVISPFTVHIGFKSDLDLPAFLAQAELQPVSIEKVNVPRIWSLVTCVKE